MHFQLLLSQESNAGSGDNRIQPGAEPRVTPEIGQATVCLYKYILGYFFRIFTDGGIPQGNRKNEVLVSLYDLRIECLLTTQYPANDLIIIRSGRHYAL